MEKKSVKKIILSVISLFLVAIITFFANAFLGNPVSKLLAKNAAERYLVEAYPGSDFEIDGVYFDFKGTNYNVHVASPGSIDSEFSLVYDMSGNILADSYETSVVERGNTALRINYAYSEAVDAVFEGDSLSYPVSIGFGDIEFVSAGYKNEPDIPGYAIVTDELILDKEYDANEFAKKAGHLTVYVEDADVTAERLAEMLLELRTAFDKAELPFYAVDFVLESERSEDFTEDVERVEVMSFLYKDIYLDGLTERVNQSNQKAVEYYAQQNALKEEAINNAE